VTSPTLAAEGDDLKIEETASQREDVLSDSKASVIVRRDVA